MKKINDIDFEIPNWSKYNPRTDRKVKSWLRVENTIFTNQDLLTLDSTTKLIYMMLLCEASKKDGSANIKINYALVLLNDVSYENFMESIQKLTDSGVIWLRSDTKEKVMIKSGALRTNERTNERTNDTNDTNVLTSNSKFDLSEIWNLNCGDLPKCKAFTDKRKKAALARLKDIPERKSWEEIIQRMTKSNFCNGDSDSGWRATFDFLLKPDTHVKVIEGKYDNAGKKGEVAIKAQIDRIDQWEES